MSTEWIVRLDVKNPETTVRHKRGRLGGSACRMYCGEDFRVLAPEELKYFRYCRQCVMPEHDGPFESASEAGTLVRGAASAVALASLDLAELGYRRMAARLKGEADKLFNSAECMEPDDS